MMGIIPLKSMPGETMCSLGLTAEATFTIRGLANLAPKAKLTVEATSPDGKKKSFQVLARIDDSTDLEYVRQGGILQEVLRERLRELKQGPASRPGPKMRTLVASASSPPYLAAAATGGALPVS